MPSLIAVPKEEESNFPQKLYILPTIWSILGVLIWCDRNPTSSQPRSSDTISAMCGGWLANTWPTDRINSVFIPQNRFISFGGFECELMKIMLGRGKIIKISYNTLQNFQFPPSLSTHPNPQIVPPSFLGFQLFFAIKAKFETSSIRKNFKVSVQRLLKE